MPDEKDKVVLPTDTVIDVLNFLHEVHAMASSINFTDRHGWAEISNKLIVAVRSQLPQD